MVYRRFLAFAVILLFTALLQAIDIDRFYQQARAAFDSVKSLQANVAQTNEYTQSKSVLLSSGKLFYKPGNLLIDYSKPGIQKLIIKGNKVMIYDKGSKTVIRTSNKEGITNPLQIVDKYWSSSRKELISEDTLSIKIRLFPNNIENLKKLEVNFNRRNFMITELSRWDNSGNKVKYRFLNIRTGVLIPSSKWTFTPPKGVKVIEQ
jgi:chaperone LolA